MGSGMVTMMSSMVPALAAYTEIPVVIAQSQRWNTAGFPHWDLYYGKEFLIV